MNISSGQETTGSPSFSIEPEFILLIAGGVLTLIVLAFVGYLISQIVKEQRAIARSSDGGDENDA